MPGRRFTYLDQKVQAAYTLGIFFSHRICNPSGNLAALPARTTWNVTIPTIPTAAWTQPQYPCWPSAHRLDSSPFQPVLSYHLFPKTSQQGSWKMSAKSRHSPALHFRERANSCSAWSYGLWPLTSNLTPASPSSRLPQQNACFAISHMCCPLSP